MPLTDGTRVETIEEGGGIEEAPMGASIDYFFSLLTNARDILREVQRTVGKVDADLVKFKARLDDWLEFQEGAWGGADGRQGRLNFGNGQTTNSPPPTSTSPTSPQDGALAGRAGGASATGKRGKLKGKNK